LFHSFFCFIHHTFLAAKIIRNIEKGDIENSKVFYGKYYYLYQYDIAATEIGMLGLYRSSTDRSITKS